MPTTCPAAPETTCTPTGDHSGRPSRPALAEVLDLQEAELPGTANALQHFFAEA